MAEAGRSAPAGRLEGKVVALTGATGLLGRTLAARLAREGVAGLVVSDLREGPVDELAGSLGALGVAADVRDPDAMDGLVDATVERFGQLDVLIANAGVISPNGRIHNLSTDDWRTAFDVNVLGTVNGIRSAVRVMRPRRQGAIVATASVAALTAWPYAGPYGASKAAVVALVKVAALEYARDGIRANCVCPGVFPSAMHAELPAEAMEALAQRHPLGLGTPEDVVGAFIHLASDEARWTTGTALVVDGGYAAP